MANKEYQHRVITSQGDTYTTNTPKEAGKIYRDIKSRLPEGQSIELQRRELGPWQTIEKS